MPASAYEAAQRGRFCAEYMEHLSTHVLQYMVSYFIAYLQAGVLQTLCASQALSCDIHANMQLGIMQLTPSCSCSVCRALLLCADVGSLVLSSCSQAC